MLTDQAEHNGHTLRQRRSWRARRAAKRGLQELSAKLWSSFWLIVIFAQRHGIGPQGERIKHYYVPESVGIATGFLVAALHDAGLATLTHTPSPMGFLSRICGRPENEKPVILLVAGHPAAGATVPDIGKKEPDEVIVWMEP